MADRKNVHCSPDEIYVEEYTKKDGVRVPGHCRKNPRYHSKEVRTKEVFGFQTQERKLTKKEAERRRSEYAIMTHTSPEDYDLDEFRYEDVYGDAE